MKCLIFYLLLGWVPLISWNWPMDAQQGSWTSPCIHKLLPYYSINQHQRVQTAMHMLSVHCTLSSSLHHPYPKGSSIKDFLAKPDFWTPPSPSPTSSVWQTPPWVSKKHRTKLLWFSIRERVHYNAWTLNYYSYGREYRFWIKLTWRRS